MINNINKITTNENRIFINSRLDLSKLSWGEIFYLDLTQNNSNEIYLIHTITRN